MIPEWCQRDSNWTNLQIMKLKMEIVFLAIKQTLKRKHIKSQS